MLNITTMSNMIMLLLLFMRVANTSATAVSAQSTNAPHKPFGPNPLALNKLTVDLHAINDSSVHFDSSSAQDPQLVFQQLLHQIDDAPSTIHLADASCLQPWRFVEPSHSDFSLEPRDVSSERLEWVAPFYNEQQGDHRVDDLPLAMNQSQPIKKKCQAKQWVRLQPVIQDRLDYCSRSI